MLLKDFYTITEYNYNQTDSTIIAQIQINTEHKIFQGHFPENPVVPGVMVLQIIKELLEKATEQNLMLTSASQIKYLVMIIPERNRNICFAIQIKPENNQLKTNCVVSNETVVYVKFNGLFSF